MPSSRPIDRLRDIVDNCERIERHIAGMDLEAYSRDEKIRDAVERCLQRSSEAAYKLGNYLDGLYSGARWKATRGVGNPLRHQYDKISDARSGTVCSKPCPQFASRRLPKYIVSRRHNSAMASRRVYCRLRSKSHNAPQVACRQFSS